MNKVSVSVKLMLPLMSCCVAAKGLGPQSGSKHPNVLFILTDDQGWGDVGIHGNDLIRTPTMDSLYKSSVVLDRFMVSPLSAPTRASLLSGRYHLRTGVSSVSSGLENMDPSETTLAELYREAGYRTGCFGKWHSGTYYPYTPNGQGFDDFLGFCCGHWANYYNPELQRNETVTRGEGYITDIITDEAISFIKENRDRPFFCYVPYNAPHSPFQVPDEYYDHYKDLPVANERDRAVMASIYAMVECVDYNMSRLIETLDELGIRENTIVVYMSDNGPVHVERYNGGMRGMKGTVNEGGVRVPCYINWKGHLPHRIVEQPYAHVDMMPTLMELCGIADYSTAYPVDGISMCNVLYGGKPDRKLRNREIFTHRRKTAMEPYVGGSRNGRYRFELWSQDDVRLYDMLNDPSETTNIFDRNNPHHMRMYSNYMEWYDSASKGVKDGKRDIPVGYKEAPQVRIPAPEGIMHGALKCYGYPNQNWVNHFRTESDSLSFVLDVVREGTYFVSVDYSNPEDNLKETMSVRVNGNVYSAPMPKFLTEPRYSPDRVERDEAPDMTWGRLCVGKVYLKAGKNDMSLFATGVKDKASVRVKTIILDRYDE